MEKAGKLKKLKVTSAGALKVLERYFKHDLAEIYKEIGKFREGVKCLEVYIQ